jgi:two-component system, NtrC family, nitrogen regulation sensor histidine kinase GlnL
VTALASATPRPSGLVYGEHPILSAMPSPVVVVDDGLRLRFVNPAAEQLFAAGSALLAGRPLADLVAFDSTLFDLVRRVRLSGNSISEYGVGLPLQRGEARLVDMHVAPLGEDSPATLVVLHPCSVARKLGRQLSHRGAARSVAGLAQTLAHEIKNPLSGIRGAAQLLEAGVAADEDRQLTRLICEETDRICGLVDRMEQFSDGRPIERRPVNIHQVLERVRRLAASGFARRVRFVERYDPSLPDVDGDRDRLVQVFLNLVKNAAEAAPRVGGEIVLATAYQHGIRMAVPGSEQRVHLPLLVSVADNGDGIPEDLRAHLFDPFVTTKRNGTGLGLALVAKVVGDHGGVIEFDSQPRRTVFKVFLPMASGDGSA